MWENRGDTQECINIFFINSLRWCSHKHTSHSYKTHKSMLFFKIVLGAIGLGFRLLYHQIQFSDKLFLYLMKPSWHVIQPLVAFWIRLTFSPNEKGLISAFHNEKQSSLNALTPAFLQFFLITIGHGLHPTAFYSILCLISNSQGQT